MTYYPRCATCGARSDCTTTDCREETVAAFKNNRARVDTIMRRRLKNMQIGEDYDAGD